MISMPSGILSSIMVGPIHLRSTTTPRASSLRARTTSSSLRCHKSLCHPKCLKYRSFMHRQHNTNQCKITDSNCRPSLTTARCRCKCSNSSNSSLSSTAHPSSKCQTIEYSSNSSQTIASICSSRCPSRRRNLTS